jgi:ABC-type branched-subunit amino acid transport system substrate-binding protein
MAFLAVLGKSPAKAAPPAFEIAVQSSLSGGSSLAGNAFLEAIRFAVDEANAAGQNGPRFDLDVVDDKSMEAGSQAAARAIVAGDAAIVLGPARTPLAVSACRIYGQARLPVIASTLHADALTRNPTTFRTVISTGEIGESLADYLGLILRQKRAVVFTIDNSYGRPLATRFRVSAMRQGLQVEYRSFATRAERDAITHELEAARNPAPIVLGMEYEDAYPTLVRLRRAGYRGLVLGTATMARATFISTLAQEPEERSSPGSLSDNTYATSPMILDSANAAILAFANRFKANLGHEPSWEAVQAYDGALLAMAAYRDALTRHPDLASLSSRERRAAVLASVESFDAPTRAVEGLNGPIWFTPDRIRRQPVRIGRFHAGLFESAPVQLVPVAQPDPGELASGAVFQTEPGRYYRLQRVVQTGTYLNLIPRIDFTKSTFGADFYVWLRYARDAGRGAADPLDISFPSMVSGHFDPAAAAESTETADGTEYRLWRIQGEFRTDFDLHRFPFDRQELPLRFFNARASSDRIVYVLDRRATNGGRAGPQLTDTFESGGDAALAAPPVIPADGAVGGALISPNAFANLTQWRAIGAGERRDTLVTPSALGDLRRVGLQTPRELSGFVTTFTVERRTAAVLVKVLIPMLLMTVVLYTTLHFPAALSKEKVTVAVTAVLSGAVLLSAVNSQLGGVGYTLAIEYAFYAFFALGLLCVVYVMASETFRHGNRLTMVTRVERATRVVFVTAVLLTALLAGTLYGPNNN